MRIHFFYSKCPHCGEHGIPIFPKSNQYKKTIKCKRCGKLVKCRKYLARSIILSVGAVTVWIGKALGKALELSFDFTLWSLIALFLIEYALILYLFPVEKAEDAEMKR